MNLIEEITLTFNEGENIVTQRAQIIAMVNSQAGKTCMKLWDDTFKVFISPRPWWCPEFLRRWLLSQLLHQNITRHHPENIHELVAMEIQTKDKKKP